MSFIRRIPVEEASGLLRKLFDAALARTGRVWNVTHVMSLNPRTMDASGRFYRAVMFGPSPLSRVQREMMATVTAKAADGFDDTGIHDATQVIAYFNYITRIADGLPEDFIRPWGIE